MVEASEYPKCEVCGASLLGTGRLYYCKEECSKIAREKEPEENA